MRTCALADCDSPFYAKALCEKHYQRWRKHGDPTVVKKPSYADWSNANPEIRRDRLMSKVVHDPETGCWLWQGTKTLAGYGQMRVAGVRMYTHRISYELNVGPIPAGLELDHLCSVRECCNPDHLDPVTHAVNVARGERPTRTHCLHGHEYSGRNLVFNSTNGYRACRQCDIDSQRRKRQREAASRVAITQGETA